MGEFKFDPNFERDVVKQAELAEAIKSTGQAKLSIAESLASTISDSGDFAGSIRGKFSRDGKGKPHFYVYSEDEGALAIEFGSSKQSGKRVLGRAIRGE